MEELAARVTVVRAQGAPEPQAPHGADRDRDRARRRDDQRHVRAHGLDRQRVRLDLHRRYRNTDAAITRQVAVRPQRQRRRRDAAVRRVAARRRCGRCPTSQDAIGGVAARRTDRQERQGDRRSAARRTSASASTRRSRSSTRLTLVSGAWPRANEVVIDKSTAEKKDITVGQRRSACRPRARSSSCAISGIVKFGSVELDRRRDARRLRPCRRRSGCSTRQGKLDQIRVAAKPGVTPQSSSRRSATILPPDTQVRTGDAQAREDAQDTDEFISFLRILPARVRRDRALRRRVRDRQLALDHDCAAHARARDAADARRVAPPGAALGHARGARDRRPRVDRRALPRPRCSRRGCSRCSTRSASRCRTTAPASRRARSIVALVVGIVVTLLASLRPALRATRVPPIAAVREGACCRRAASPGSGRRSRRCSRRRASRCSCSGSSAHLGTVDGAASC